MTQFRGTATLTRRLEAQAGDFGALFVAMLARFERVRFARLQIGKLPATVELIRNFASPAAETP